ncbi:MAG: T9SS type A sorting domain-containing protein [Candidatus Krumholzibacteriota bacterium]|nr:T9SS type A sorting domain-containing protein [Candidatus Krumholzibacteriota bacterium]
MSSRLNFISSILLLLTVGVSSPSQAAHWPLDGAPISTAVADQQDPQLAPDGSGGSIITWHDSRVGSWDVYAQRINANGTVLWTINGIAVKTGTGGQIYPQIVSDGVGGAIICWYDDNSWDVYAQRIDGAGNKLWTSGGVPICTSPYQQSSTRIISDGSSGAIIVWLDDRNTANASHDIYAQRIDPGGNVLWAADGVPVTTSPDNQTELRIVPGYAGEVIVTWHDDRSGNWDVYAQKLIADGSAGWTTHGVPLGATSYSEVYPDIISDGGGGAIIAWRDARDGTWNVHAQRINAAGTTLWTTDGIPVIMNMGTPANPRITADGGGGGIITWYMYNGSDNDIYAQRIDGSGNLLWNPAGEVVCAHAYNQDSPRIATDGSAGAVISWLDGRITGDFSTDIYIQRIDSYGMIRWGTPGAPVVRASADQQAHQMTPDGVGGVFVAWHDKRDGNWDVYVQRVSEGLSPVSTQLQDFHAALDGSSARLDWTLCSCSEEVSFHILRSLAESGLYEPLEDPEIIREGLSFSFRDNDLETGASYTYRVEVEDQDGRRILFETGNLTAPAVPFVLEQNFPNPFNPSTTINYYLDAAAPVKLEIYNVQGIRVSCLVDAFQGKGPYSVTWNGKDINGNNAVSGLYLYRLTAGKKFEARKMLLLR